MRLTSTMSSSRFWRYASSAAAVELDLDPVGVGQAGVRGVGAPPALEAPETLVGRDRGRRFARRRPHDTKARHPISGATRIAGLEIEEALEHGGRAGAVRLTFAAVHDDHAGRTRTQLIGRTRDRRATAALRTIAAREPARGLRGLRLRRRARRPPSAPPPPAATPAATRAPAARAVLHRFRAPPP